MKQNKKKTDELKQIDEYIHIPLYFSIINRKVVYDEDSIREFFEMKLKDIIK